MFKNSFPNRNNISNNDRNVNNNRKNFCLLNEERPRVTTEGHLDDDNEDANGDANVMLVLLGKKNLTVHFVVNKDNDRQRSN